MPEDREALLVVDDELANLQKLKRTFVSDFEVYEARNGEEAFELLRKRRFSAIITDQRMPGMSGVELLRESLQWSPHAVRIILTGYTEVSDLMGAINEGQVHRYITKPWEPFSLKRTVLQDIEHWKLKQENQALTEQMRIAGEVQRYLFPQAPPKIQGLEYHGVCRTAVKVGGDLYDFLRLEPGTLWLTVVDISGKGISAALLMANVQALLRSQAPLFGRQVEKLLASVNQLLHATTEESKFATIFYGFYDVEEQILRYANGGHCPPILVRKNGEVEELPATGCLVGMFEEADFRSEERRLRRGDTLVIYTDGITECENSSQEEFGEERLRQLLAENIDLAIEDLAEKVLHEVNAYSSSSQQHDDQTLVLLRVDSAG